MMDFLEKLYSYEYFPQILFATIAILLILLVVVILFGKKDEKVRKEEETKRLELMGLDAFAEEEKSPISLEINKDTEIKEPIVSEPIVNETNLEEAPIIKNVEYPEISDDVHLEAQELVDNALSNSISNDVAIEESDVPSETIEENETVNKPSENFESFMIPDFEIFKEEEKALYQTTNVLDESEIPLSLNELHQKDEKDYKADEEKIEETEDESTTKVNLENTAVLPEFNFDELASSINKELDEINKLQAQASKISEQSEKAIPNQVDVTPIKEVTKFTPSSVFSSVYVNKEKEVSNVIEEKTEPSNDVKPVLEEKVEEEIPVIKNIITEPISKEKVETPEVTTERTVVKPVVTNPFIFDMPAKKEEKVEIPKAEENIPNVNVPDFSSFQNETYDIK